MQAINKLKIQSINSFARKRSANKQLENEIMANLLPSYSTIIPEDGGIMPELANVFFGQKDNFVDFFLEIGFGNGENLINLAKKFPNIGFVGCELFRSGVVKILKELDQKKLENVRIWFGNAFDLLYRIPNNSIARVYLLHPDPWPKNRHHKRRILDQEFLSLIHDKLKPEGVLIIASDDPSYQQAILGEINRTLLFKQNKDFNSQIITTEYGRKAAKKGLVTEYYYLQKI